MSLFSRCKLFFKKGESWQDKGVGNLHLKPCDGKTQLLIRADTNLGESQNTLIIVYGVIICCCSVTSVLLSYVFTAGNILLNILLTSSVPASRQGKNNVLLVCVPNPPLDEKKPDDTTAVSMLIRVKAAADADELLEKISDAKNAASQ